MKIPFEVIGGVAVTVHILGVHLSRSFVTRDIDLLVQRHDLQRIVSSGESAGYTGRMVSAGFMLIRSGQQLEESVHRIEFNTATDALREFRGG